MTAISYIAKRKLAPGHVAGNSYAFDIEMQRIDPGAKFERTRHKAVGGNTETWLLSIEEQVDLATDLLDIADPRLAYMREFLQSVADGSAFMLDFDGTVAAPVSPQPYDMDSDAYKEARTGTRFIAFALTVRAL